MAGEKLKIAVVGCGNMARAWLAAATRLRSAEIAALVDVRHEAAQAMAERFELPESVIYSDYRTAIKQTGANVVFDVTVPEVHDKVTIDSLRLGCHVLGEKPMSVSLARARKMVREAEKAQRIYAVIQNRRYEPNIRAFGKLLGSGRLGELQELHSDFFVGPHFGGFRDEMDYPLLLDMAIHTFDAARFISGADPVSVYCHSFNPGRSWYRHDASAVVIFEMTGGIVFTYRGSWCAEGLSTSWNSQWRAVCSRGSATWDGAEQIKAQRIGAVAGLTRQSKDVPVKITPMKHVGHEAIIREFAGCVRTGKLPQTHCKDNIKSLAMVLAAVESAKSGRRTPVRW